MKERFILFGLILSLAATGSPALADDGSGEILRELAIDARAQAGDLLLSCAEQRGLQAQGEPVYLTTEDSAAVLMPLAGVESLTRADLANWTNIGIFTAAGPADAEAPSGTFVVRVRAEPGSTVGQFEIVDGAGVVVQSGELTINDDPDDPDSVPTASQPASQPVGSLEEILRGSGPTTSTTDQLHGFWPYCYYPYYWHWRIYPYYWHGCHWWWYRWPWGHLRFRYCWWPSYYHCTRWFCHWW